ncbi:hypothetical protein [Porphyromonas uenonis]|jgi:hypothetical protein|uniref:Lipoprotein n=1 Tax=Porphyromonas uenonis 60-3 TaxID=596327 RepID=C2MDS4_9PORP|nr:hypothetical protein [Porphyromonas uenonis]EEK16090.1 hypothetical protein PORUE0001_1355 [Porphyromonas uenonis 60-3]
MKTLISWSTPLLLLVLFAATSCQSQKPTPKPQKEKEAISYKLPIVDYDFKGSIDDIVAFETALGHTLDKSQSDATTLTFSTGKKEFSETVYRLQNKRIVEVYQPSTSGEAVEDILPQLTKELKEKGWSEWPMPVSNGQCDAAFQLSREINGAQSQIGSVVVHTRTNNVKKTYPSITFIFSRIAEDIDPNTVVLPDIYLDGLDKTKEEIKKYYEPKGCDFKTSAAFLDVSVDNPAYKDRVSFFFQEGNPKCHSIIITAVNFGINKSKNLPKQLEKLGFEFDSEEGKAISKYFNEEKQIWAFVRFYPLSQLDQPNITFTRHPKNF